MSSDITLSAGVRANLLSLQNTAKLMQTTQKRLATGKKVNSALDNPLNFFTSQSLEHPRRPSQRPAQLDVERHSDHPGRQQRFDRDHLVWFSSFRRR